METADERCDHACIRTGDRIDTYDLFRRTQIQQLQKRLFAHAGVAGHDTRTLDQRLLRRQIVLRHILLDDAHVGHADEHIAVCVQNRQIHGGIRALRLIQMGRVDSRVFAGTADKCTEGIVSNAT